MQSDAKLRSQRVANFQETSAETTVAPLSRRGEGGSIDLDPASSASARGRKKGRKEGRKENFPAGNYIQDWKLSEISSSRKNSYSCHRGQRWHLLFWIQWSRLEWLIVRSQSLVVSCHFNAGPPLFTRQWSEARERCSRREFAHHARRGIVKLVKTVIANTLLGRFLAVCLSFRVGQRKRDRRNERLKRPE